MNKKRREIIRNSIITPDGTELISMHCHDYRSYQDKNGSTYAVDGGREYLRRCGKFDYKDTSVYDDEPYEIIRDAYYRMNQREIHPDHKEFIRKDTDGNMYVPLSHISDEWLSNIITYNAERNIIAPFYEREREYRLLNNITVPR